MPTNTPYSFTPSTVGILDPTASLLTTPTLLTSNTHLPDANSTNPSTLLSTNLPPLSYLLLADRLAELYEMVFPDRPEWLSEEVVDWQNEEDVAAAVETFLGRVSDLFPVHDDIWDMDLEVVEWRLWEIPVIPYGYDVYYDDWMDLKEPAAYLLHMLHSRHDKDNPSGRDDFADLYSDHQAPRYLEPDRLVESLRQVWAERRSAVEQAKLTDEHKPLPEPLNALPDLIAMLEQNTGNAWMDVGELSLADGGGYPVWSRENVEWLAAEWQQAKPVLDGVHRLLDWQNETKEEIHDKLTAVRDALLEAYNRTQEELEQSGPEETP